MIRKLLAKFGYHQVDWYYSLGRHYLTVNGYAVAVENDKCRDAELVSDMHARCGNTWDRQMIEQVMTTPSTSMRFYS